MTHTAHEDNAGGVHISNGKTAWFLGFDYTGNLAADLAAWESGEWEPSENDGQTPETLAEYAASSDRTDTTPRNRGGRPRVGDQVKIAFPADMLAAIDADAVREGITRSEWVRQACAALLPR